MMSIETKIYLSLRKNSNGLMKFPCRVSDYDGSFNPEEVAEVFLAPIVFFANTPAKVYEVDWKPVFPEDFPFDKIYGGRNYGWRPRKSRIRFYEYEGRVIWGMTARIIENFVHLSRNLRSSGDQGNSPQK